LQERLVGLIIALTKGHVQITMQNVVLFVLLWGIRMAIVVGPVFVVAEETDRMRKVNSRN